MRLRLSHVVERARASLFLQPLLATLGAIVVAVATLWADRSLADDPDLPLGLISTVESARAVLTTVAGATLTVAGIAFSVSLLVIQQATSQYSPRVVHGLFRDDFNKWVMGIVVGTFAYCLIVLRSVRAGVGSGDDVIPHVSVLVALVLGLVSVLAIVAFIDHSAHWMDVSHILGDVARRTCTTIETHWGPVAGAVSSEGTVGSGAAVDVPERSPGLPIRFDESGWVQQIDLEQLLAVAPVDGVVHLHTAPGRHAVRGAPICTVAPAVGDLDVDELERQVRTAVAVGSERTMQQDVSFGIRQMVDVALVALSPGVNDPTTAQDALFHTTDVLGDLLRRDPPPLVHHADGRHLVLGEAPDHEELVGLAYDEIRRAAAPLPTVCVYLLESISLLAESLRSTGLDDRVPPLRRQADLVLAGAESAELLPADLELVRVAHRKRFG